MLTGRMPGMRGGWKFRPARHKLFTVRTETRRLSMKMKKETKKSNYVILAVLIAVMVFLFMR